MNKSIFYLLLAINAFLNNLAIAEFSCTADVRYKWRPLSAQESNSASNPKTDNAATNTPEAKTEDSSVKDVFWRTVEVKGATEDEAKNKLKVLVNEERQKADFSCRDAHENQSKCLANKYTQHSALQTTLTYSQRRELEKKMAEDCQVAAGSCLGSATTEPVCKESVAADAAEESADAAKGKDKEKDKGAKKK
jgi:hypothetical protein